MVGSGKENFPSPERMLEITCSVGEKIQQRTYFLGGKWMIIIYFLGKSGRDNFMYFVGKMQRGQMDAKGTNELT